jgi:hypothetical protein
VEEAPEGAPDEATFDTTRERVFVVCERPVPARRAVAMGRNATALAVEAWANMRGTLRGPLSAVEGDARAGVVYGDRVT